MNFKTLFCAEGLIARNFKYIKMSEFKQYRRKSVSEMCEWEEGMVIDHVSISEEDKKNGSPKKGDMIARNPKNHNDQWLVAKAYFDDNLEPID